MTCKLNYIILTVMLAFTRLQLEKLSELFLDLSKGLFVSSLALPILTRADFAIFTKLFIGGLICTYFSLKLLEIKKAEL